MHRRAACSRFCCSSSLAVQRPVHAKLHMRTVRVPRPQRQRTGPSGSAHRRRQSMSAQGSMYGYVWLCVVYARQALKSERLTCRKLSVLCRSSEPSIVLGMMRCVGARGSALRHEHDHVHERFESVAIQLICGRALLCSDRIAIVRPAHTDQEACSLCTQLQMHPVNQSLGRSRDQNKHQVLDEKHKLDRARALGDSCTRHATA